MPWWRGKSGNPLRLEYKNKPAEAGLLLVLAVAQGGSSIPPLNPVVLGEGTPLFKGPPKKADFALTETRKFKSGRVLLIYRRMEK
jgi:hypothetical protein